VSIIPFPIVEATAVEKTNGPMKQKIEAMIIANRGFIAWVAREIAIVFADDVNYFVETSV